MTVAEVDACLKVHRTTVYRLLKARMLPGFRLASAWRYNREQIDSWRLMQGAKILEGLAQKPRDHWQAEKAAL